MFSLFLRIVACACCFLGFGIAHAQEAAASAGKSARVELSTAEAANFDLALAALSQQSRVAIVVEGAPLSRKLTPEKADALLKSGTAEAVANGIAAAYDYEVLRDGRGTGRPSSPQVFVLGKLYSDPRDLPAVTFEECEAASREILRMLKAFAPTTPLGNHAEFVKRFISGFTLEQMRSFLPENGGFPIANLSPAQRDEVQRMALDIYVSDPCHYLSNYIHRYGQARNATVVKQKDRSQPIAIPGLFVANTKYNLQSFVPFLYLASGVGQVPELDTPKPDLTQVTAAKVPTLREAVADLQKRVPQPLLVIDPMYNDKPVTLFGAANATPAQILQAVADVFGLRLRPEKEGAVLHLTRVSVPMPQSIMELYPTAQRVLPLFFQRTQPQGYQDRIRAEYTEQKKKEAAALDKISKDFEAVRITFEQMGVLIEPYTKSPTDDVFAKKKQFYVYFISRTAVEAVRYLNFVAEASLKESQGKPVPFSSLTPAARSMVGTILLANFVYSINAMPQKEPPLYIRDFDRAVVTFQPLGTGKKRIWEFLIKAPLVEGENIGYQAGFGVPDDAITSADK